MNKMGTLIATALVSLSFAAAAMAVDVPQIGGPTSVDAPAASSATPSYKAKHKKKKKPAAFTSAN